MREIRVASWNELQDIVFDGAFDTDLMRYRTNFIFRGLNKASVQGMTPTLNRYCGHDLSLEEALLRNFRKYAYAELGSYNDFWETVTLGQHYGLPTRLLDWSYSPLVAAHFATEDIDLYDEDGAILCVNFVRLKKYLPPRLQNILKKERSNSFTMEMLARELPDFAAMRREAEDPYVLFYEPSNISERIAGQYSLFSVSSDPQYLMDQIVPVDDPQVFYRIIIPKEIKLEIRDKLDFINISERTIYPGVSGICKWMTRRYANLGPRYNHHIDDAGEKR